MPLNFREALAELEGAPPEPHGARPVAHAAAATLLADPQLSYPSIPVSRTSRKGTAAAVAAAHNVRAGISAGLCTSPRLRSVTRLTIGLQRGHHRAQSSPRSTSTSCRTS